jgi:hypothetical protein
LMAATSTSATLIAMSQERREYVSNICARFIEDYVMQLDNFKTKGKSGRKIHLGEVVLIHDEYTKRLMWSTNWSLSSHRVVMDSFVQSFSRLLTVI